MTMTDPWVQQLFIPERFICGSWPHRSDLFMSSVTCQQYWTDGGKTSYFILRCRTCDIGYYVYYPSNLEEHLNPKKANYLRLHRRMILEI